MKKIAVLTSGGIDSNVLLGFFLRKYDEVTPIYIRCGLIWEKAEIYWLKKFLRAIRQTRGSAPPLKPLVILKSPVTDLQKDWSVTGKKTPDYHSRDEEVYLQGRNLLILSKAATYCALHKIPAIAIGSLAGNPFPDATPQFFKDFSRVASQALGGRIQVVAPFRHLKKKEILKKGKNLPLHLSFTCLSPRGNQPCGDCNKCAERESLAARKYATSPCLGR